MKNLTQTLKNWYDIKGSESIAKPKHGTRVIDKGDIFLNWKCLFKDL